jgi:hypothetical protein
VIRIRLTPEFAAAAVNADEFAIRAENLGFNAMPSYRQVTAAGQDGARKEYHNTLRHSDLAQCGLARRVHQVECGLSQVTGGRKEICRFEIALASLRRRLRRSSDEKGKA